MRFGTSHSGHRSRGCRTHRRSCNGCDPARPSLLPPVLCVSRPGGSATSALSLCALCVSSLSPDFQLSTINSATTQLPCFHNLPYSSTTAQESLLCFHNLTNPFSCNQFLLTTIQKHRGYIPLAAELPEPILELHPLIPIAPVACHFPDTAAPSDANRKLRISESVSRSFPNATRHVAMSGCGSVILRGVRRIIRPRFGPGRATENAWGARRMPG